MVDGIDVSQIGLNDVRGRNMCIIPQDPLLLAGTLRRNLDPLDRHTDQEILDALDAVQMLEPVRALPMGLDQPVEVRFRIPSHFLEPCVKLTKRHRKY